jgi:hypothetical protein
MSQKVQQAPSLRPTAVKDPNRYVQIEIGPGDSTTYTVGSDDSTWTLGRHYGLTEKLLSDRSHYAKYRVPAPGMSIQKSNLLAYEDLPWKTDRNWRIRLAGATSCVPFGVNYVCAFVAILLAFTYFRQTTRRQAETNTFGYQLCTAIFRRKKGMHGLRALSRRAQQLDNRGAARKPERFQAVPYPRSPNCSRSRNHACTAGRSRT